MSDFVVWEPGTTKFCVLCLREWGGADPPGPWQRHYSRRRRRIPIFDGRGRGVFGYLEYIRQ